MNLEHPDEASELPSSFTPVALQYELALKVSGDSTEPVDDAAAAAYVLQKIEAWEESLPGVYRASDPDTSWDTEHPYLSFQRTYLHLISNLIRLIPLKHFLTKDVGLGFTELEIHLRAVAVKICMDVVKTARELSGQMYSQAASKFIVDCVVVNIAGLLTSAVMDDRGNTLPYRELFLETMNLALDMIYQRKSVGGVGSVAHPNLPGLMRPLTLYPNEDALAMFRTTRGRQADSGLSGTNATQLLTMDHLAIGSDAVDNMSDDQPSVPSSNAGDDTAPSQIPWEGDFVPTEEDFMNTDWIGLGGPWDTPYSTL